MNIIDKNNNKKKDLNCVNNMNKLAALLPVENNKNKMLLFPSAVFCPLSNKRFLPYERVCKWVIVV